MGVSSDVRGDELLELSDAVLCAPGAVHSAVELTLLPEHRRGHGAMSDALNRGRIDTGRLRSLPAGLSLPRFLRQGRHTAVGPGSPGGAPTGPPGWTSMVNSLFALLSAGSEGLVPPRADGDHDRVRHPGGLHELLARAGLTVVEDVRPGRLFPPEAGWRIARGIAAPGGVVREALDAAWWRRLCHVDGEFLVAVLGHRIGGNDSGWTRVRHAGSGVPELTGGPGFVALSPDGQVLLAEVPGAGGPRVTVLDRLPERLEEAAAAAGRDGSRAGRGVGGGARPMRVASSLGGGDRVQPGHECVRGQARSVGMRRPRETASTGTPVAAPQPGRTCAPPRMTAPAAAPWRAPATPRRGRPGDLQKESPGGIDTEPPVATRYDN